jgi:hypothetical protein
MQVKIIKLVDLLGILRWLGSMYLRESLRWVCSSWDGVFDSSILDKTCSVVLGCLRVKMGRKVAGRRGGKWSMSRAVFYLQLITNSNASRNYS